MPVVARPGAHSACDVEDMPPPAHRLFVFGHRGAAGLAPENTLAAVARGLAAGADGIEFDVQQVDGTLIVLHDDTLERTTSGRGPLTALSVDQLRALDAGDGQRVPLLAEVVRAVAAPACLNVEVKMAGIGAAVIDALERLLPPAEHPRLLLSSFDEATTAALAARRGAMRLGILYEGAASAALARARALAAHSLHLPLGDLDPALVAAARACGLATHVYTVNDPADIARCHVAGVDGVFSDFPDRVVAFNRSLDTGARP